MGLSRLDNFLKSIRGTIIYVDPNSLDSTDSIENSGNSLTRPFKTIQRALAEAARFSYQRGNNNDRFNKTTILLYPGEHIVDNRPGYIPTAVGEYSARSGETGLTDLTEWDLNTIFDLSESNNALYKLNSVHGGVIVPRGTSIVGLDLRKTKIRPLYVPNPENNNIERSCIFRVTGGCYFWQFTILDADPNGFCYKDYRNAVFVPNFSHHKLSGFEYADGVNGIYIDDDFLNGATKIDTTRTDLDMYYEKIAAVYGPSAGPRDINPDYGFGTVDIQPVIDEYRIVGSKGLSVGISSIRSGDGETGSTTITVELVEPIEELNVDSPIQIQGVDDLIQESSYYDGQHTISTVISDTKFTYKVQRIPTDPLPSPVGATADLVVDTVTSASPYIFNISLRSVYGMCGLLADGDKATGFKSMVVAQYTGIGLQKDANAFVKFDDTQTSVLGTYSPGANLNTNSRSRFKPSYENYHIKGTNDAFIQLVSVFAIGYAQHFVAENGADLAINNSNSNFGSKAFVASGFKRSGFPQDDCGYITHIIPPKELDNKEISVEFLQIDVGLTTSRSAGTATTTRLYLYNEENQEVLPKVIFDGYHVGARENEQLNVQVFVNNAIEKYSSRIVMPNGPYNSTQSSSEKVFTVARTNNTNNITSNGVVTLNGSHSLINGESIRIISDNGQLPDGLDSNQVYYAITKQGESSLGTNQIKIARTFNDAINRTSISFNSNGGVLSVVSKVSDKNPGEVGHPVQWDGSNWYVNVSSTENAIYSIIRTRGVRGLGESTPRTYVNRKQDTRSLSDTTYRVRYVIPKKSPITARPPIEGYILQESSNILGVGVDEISQLYNDAGNLNTNSTYLRNPRFIASASWSSDVATIRTEIPHDLQVGDEVEIVNVTPIQYNGTYTVTSIVSAKEFRYALDLNANPGNLSNNTSLRDENLPYFVRKKYNKIYQVYNVQEVQEYIRDFQDGVYYLTLINCSNSPTVTPFDSENFAQPIANLYPQRNLDNPKSDPNASVSYALSEQIGQVVIDDLENSITKETLESFVTNIGIGITNIRSSSGTAHTIYTEVDHGLNSIISVSIINDGLNYGSGVEEVFYNARLVGFAGSTTGSNATAKVSINDSGSITDIKIIDGGSAYGIGNTLAVVGIATTSNHIVGVVRVTSINNNVGDSIKISGISSATNSGYNNVYRISSIPVGRSKEINVISSETISPVSSSGIGANATSSASYILTDKSKLVSSLTYNSSTGLATISFNTSHGYRVGNKIRIGGADQSVFNGDFIVERTISTSILRAKVGIVTTSTTATGTIYAYRPVLTSYGGDLPRDIESTSGRLTYQYAGITTTLGSQITTDANLDLGATSINIPNASSLGLKLGDYLIINNEIFRIRETITSNNVRVFRSLLGTPKQTHVTGSVIRKIKVIPVELRRNSIIRASGHTFEYLGFGPGNYSTALPEKQDRTLKIQETLLAQSLKKDGGAVVYTGMNSDGDFFTGNKIINSNTGKEEIYDSPIPTKTGEKNTNTNVASIVDVEKVFVGDSIKVDGGMDRNSTSEFNGPVVFTNKVTVNSDLESNYILLQGEEEVSRKISIINQYPEISGSYGDIKFNSEPSRREFVGWTYVTENKWEPFGWIGHPGVGIASGGTYVGFSTLLNIVAIGFTFGINHNETTGISTLTWTADPRIAISTGGLNTLLGNFRQLNFVGSGVTITGTTASGIATIRISGGIGAAGTTPGEPYNSLQWNDNDNFAGVPIAFYDKGNNLLRFGSQSLSRSAIFFNSSGRIGVSSASPTAKVEIVSDNDTPLLIKHLGGSSEIVRIQNGNTDTRPFIIDQSGNVGINTEDAISELDVVGNIAVTGDLRIYQTDRSNYVGLRAGSLSSNLTFILPTSYGTDGQVLTTNGSGTLSWETVSGGDGGGDIVSAGLGISISRSGQNVTVTNTGVRQIIAGNNITISPTSGRGTVTINASSGGGNLYPFTTRGFGRVL